MRTYSVTSTASVACGATRTVAGNCLEWNNFNVTYLREFAEEERQCDMPFVAVRHEHPSSHLLLYEFDDCAKRPGSVTEIRRLVSPWPETGDATDGWLVADSYSLEDMVVGGILPLCVRRGRDRPGPVA